MGNVNVKLVRIRPNLYRGTVTLRVPQHGRIRRTQTSRSPAKALHGAAALAQQVAKNPLLRAALPPQAQLALKATTMLARAAASGQLAGVFNKLKGPGALRIGKKLLSWM